MHTYPHALIGAADTIPVNEAKPIISFSPVVLPAPGRPVNLELRVTVPALGDGDLPVILLSHGMGWSNWLSSLEGYAPLVEFWAAHGFAVLQPTHLSSKTLGLTAPEGKEFYYQDRAADMVRLVDGLDAIEAAVGAALLGGRRFDRTRIAVAGHSLGAWTASMVLGATTTDLRLGVTWAEAPDSRIKAGVLLAGVGDPRDKSENGKKMIGWYGGDFSAMAKPALVVYGDADVSPHLTTRGADWHGDAYGLSPGPKALLTLKGAKHGLGGISGWDAGETQDESPERLGVVQRMTWAYLWSQLHEGDGAWAAACKALGAEQGSVESK
ncbi:Alpha/Beta hydrolase protein [Lasiosphaeria miniovina]|uniref:Alpha/Beta hydrolase protein n=1 Tax=Lasiosphaeria miniovina TaxID=1954250 RepID=A0AA39ZUC8_9PEZI|nr:Alpha/Beta hydrolase protein [Lasiosphaeria miniovina]KAK0703710.1 Alpha/Beta hydrolase protein [Lasiosphaeria miniovina]